MRPRTRLLDRSTGLLAAALCALLATSAHAAITLGAGPAYGTDRAGTTWYEEFEDWTKADLKALDPVGLADATYSYGDGLENSRDMAAFYYRPENTNLYFRVDLYDLALGAENSALNLYLAIDCAGGGQSYFPDFVNCQTDHPWELCLCLYSAGTTYGTHYRIYDKNFANITSGYLGSYFNSQLDAIEFGISRQTLINAGWDGVSALSFQPYTTKDGGGSACASGSKLTDAFLDQDRGCGDGFLNGAIASTAQGGVVYYATIAHGNQSVNRASDLWAHVYDSQANTGISGGCGFQRALDTHEIYRVPLNIHPSGSLTAGLQWAKKPGGASDPQDGPSFLSRIRAFVDGDQSVDPGALVGGVFAEHIMPYFEGPVNAASIALEDTLNQTVYGVSAASAQVMHVPERVIRSQATGMSPLTGFTFADISASPYIATVLDQVTHLHWWFYPGEAACNTADYQYKIHKINGVYCFAINDREDQDKFGNWDNGMVMDGRYALLDHAINGNGARVVVVFDDWEALGGKSFDATSGHSVPNNNPNQYNTTIRWAANHPWIQVKTLKDILALAIASPSAFVLDHGTQTNLPMQTYEWLKHASENSYNYWYYNSNAGFGGNEQDFYHLVPVITGAQGDYHARPGGVDGPPLPSGKTNGDMNTPGTLLYDTWAALQSAPASGVRDLGIASFLTMIYETAWHEEDNVNYTDSDCHGAWLYPDASWDGVNTWALQLSNHARGAGIYAACAQWVQQVRGGALTNTSPTVTTPADVDSDGESEYLLYNNRVYLAFERYGGRCVFAAAYDSVTQDAQVLIGAPLTNPSAPGEEEYSGAAAYRCAAFKDVSTGAFVDAVYTGAAYPDGWNFASPGNTVTKYVHVAPGHYDVKVDYGESLASDPLYVRVGLSPNPRDLMYHGQAHLSGAYRAATNDYVLVNSAGGAVALALGSATWNPAPANENADRRNLGLTEEAEFSVNGTASLTLTLIPGVTTVTAAATPAEASRTAMTLTAARGPARVALALAQAAEVRYALCDARGRVVARRTLGALAAGAHAFAVDARGDDGRALAGGVYVLRVQAGETTLTRRWVVLP